MIQEAVRKLIVYGLKTGLISEEDKIYTTNRLLELFELLLYYLDLLILSKHRQLFLFHVVHLLDSFEYIVRRKYNLHYLN